MKSALHRNYSSLCSLPLHQKRQERFNHSNATGIDIISKKQRAFQDSQTFSLLAVSYFSNSLLGDRNCLTIHQTGNVIACVTNYEYFKIRSFHNAATLGEAHHCPHYSNGITP